MKLNATEEENQRLKTRHKEDLKDQELKSSREIQRLKDSHLSAEQTWKEQISKLESIRMSLERVSSMNEPFDLHLSFSLSSRKSMD